MAASEYIIKVKQRHVEQAKSATCIFSQNPIAYALKELGYDARVNLGSVTFNYPYDGCPNGSRDHYCIKEEYDWYEAVIANAWREWVKTRRWNYFKEIVLLPRWIVTNRQ